MKSNAPVAKKKVGEYNIKEKIGSGSYGIVYKASKLSDPFSYAAKVMPLTAFGKETRVEMLKNEVRASKKANHLNLVKLVDHISTSHNFYLIYEYCDLGSLFDYLKDHPENRLEVNAIPIIRQICKGYNQLHELGIIHRDIKPANVMLKSSPIGPIVKLADFGFCKLFENCVVSEGMMTSHLGSGPFMSPEILANEKYTYRTDIYSIGVTYYHILFNKYPFEGKSNADILKEIVKGTIEFDMRINKVSEYSIDFIVKCLKFKQEDRAKMEQVMKHPLMNMGIKDILASPIKIDIVKATII